MTVTYEYICYTEVFIYIFAKIILNLRANSIEFCMILKLLKSFLALEICFNSHYVHMSRLILTWLLFTIFIFLLLLDSSGQFICQIHLICYT